MPWYPALPEDLATDLPSIEEIEHELTGIEVVCDVSGRPPATIERDIG